MPEFPPGRTPSDLEMLTRAMMTWRHANSTGDSELAREAADAAAFYTEQLGRPEKSVAIWERLADPAAGPIAAAPVAEAQPGPEDKAGYLQQATSAGGRVLALAGLWLYDALGGYRS